MNKTVEVSQIVELIGRKLYNFNAASELAWAWNSGENVILFGPGGYGKSDAATLFAEHLSEKGIITTDPYVMAFGQGMTEEKLLGGINIKKFQNEGEIEYLLKNAFVSHEVVIFEELWDAFPAVLLILKDILQSKCVRMGNQVMPIKTKMVIACTNRSREEVVSDDSTEALMQRFFYEQEVVWSSWETSDYLGAFKAATGLEENPLMQSVATCCAESSKGEYKISPRTAGKALKSAQINGLQCLKGAYGLGKAVKAELKVQDSRKADLEQKESFMLRYKAITQLHCQAMESQSAINVAKLAKQMWHESTIFSVMVRDSNMESAQQLNTATKDKIRDALSRVTDLIQNPPEGSFPALLKSKVQDMHRKGGILDAAIFDLIR